MHVILRNCKHSCIKITTAKVEINKVFYYESSLFVDYNVKSVFIIVTMQSFIGVKCQLSLIACCTNVIAQRKTTASPTASIRVAISYILTLFKSTLNLVSIQYLS